MKKEEKKYKQGDLQVWWMPQVPMNNPFTVDVKTIEEAKLLIDTLAFYDMFQFERNIKPDYSNAGGLCIYDEDSDGEGHAGGATVSDPNGDGGETAAEGQAARAGQFIFHRCGEVADGGDLKPIGFVRIHPFRTGGYQQRV